MELEIVSVLLTGLVFPFIVHAGKLVGFTSKQSLAVASLLLGAGYILLLSIFGTATLEQSIGLALAGLGASNKVYLYIFKDFLDADLKAQNKLPPKKK